MSARLGWLLLGALLGAGLTTVLLRRTAPVAPPPVVPLAALPAPAPRPATSGRHAWVPPPDAGADRG